MSILHDEVPNELIFAVLDHVVSAPSPPYIQKSLLALAATCRRFRELITPVILRLEVLQLKGMVDVGLLKLFDREGNLMPSTLLVGEQHPSLGSEGVVSITFIIERQRHGRAASPFPNLSTLMRDPMVPTLWRKTCLRVDDVWAVRSLVAKSRNLKRFTLEFATRMVTSSAEALRAVAALVDACLEHPEIIFVAEGDVNPWGRGAIPLIPSTQPGTDISGRSGRSVHSASDSNGTRLLRAVRSFMNSRNVAPSVVSGPSQLHLYGGVLLDGAFYMCTLGIFHRIQQSLTHLSIHTASFHVSAWSPLLTSCHFPVLQELSISAPEVSLAHCFDFLVRFSSLVTLSLDTHHINGPQWSMPKSIKPSEFLPNLTKLSAPPANVTALLFHPKALPKLHILLIKQSEATSYSDYYHVIRLLRGVRHRSVTPVSRLSFVFSKHPARCEWIRETESTLPNGQPRRQYNSFKSVTVLYTQRAIDPLPAVCVQMLLSWMEWLRQCPALETFRLDGLVRDIRIDKNDEEEYVTEPAGAHHTAVANQVREGILMNGLDAMWRACPRLQFFSIEGDRFQRPG
ncbi:hypothetical protein BKA70DRAFT_1448159 [Coprinopsis sp. MPI-PUGE-AT-0042]|nr:hypothetical protein BKA70DRAFT_1448159 [Coprinopsis sp. MPI-PUGE-AT-0042]